MSGASFETTLELWASSLRDVKARMRPLFTQTRVAASAGLFLDGLLGPERRKTGWMRVITHPLCLLGRGRQALTVCRMVPKMLVPGVIYSVHVRTRKLRISETP